MLGLRLLLRAALGAIHFANARFGSLPRRSLRSPNLQKRCKGLVGCPASGIFFSRVDPFAQLGVDRCLAALRLGELHHLAIDVIDFGRTAGVQIIPGVGASESMASMREATRLKSTLGSCSTRGSHDVETGVSFATGTLAWAKHSERLALRQRQATAPAALGKLVAQWQIR